MKKILFINTVCSQGSTGRIVKELYFLAKKEGHICKIAYGRGDAEGIEAEDAYRIGNKPSLYMTALLSRINDREGFMLRAQTKRFLKFVDSFAPNVVHLHNLHGYYLNLPLLFEYFSAHPEIKVIWTLHDCWSFTGHCAVFDTIECDKWLSGCNSCPRKKTYPASLLADNSKRNFEEKKRLYGLTDNVTVVTPSEWLAGIVKRSILSSYRVTVIRNGIDTASFSPTESDIRERYSLNGKKLLLAVSLKWYPSKGIEDILSLRRLLDDSFVIAVIGEGAKEIFTEEGFITVSKTNNREELAQWYSAADYLINPTHADNFPTVNLEALACGTPVITYNTGGSPEAIDESSGAVVYGNRAEELAEIIGARPEFCPADCISRSETFDKTKAMKGYLELYAES